MKKLYSGINSISFLKGYDPITKVFDKSLVKGMKNPDRVFTYLPIFDFPIKNQRVIQGYCCGHLAEKRANKHGGIPIVFSLDDKTIEDLEWEKEIIKKNTSNRRIVINQPSVKVKNIFVPRWYIRGGITLLDEVNIADIHRKKQIDYIPDKLFPRVSLA